jgi:integrase
MARGSIQKRGNSWSALVDLAPDPVTGKRKQKRVTAPTKREVEQLVAELLAAADKGFTDAGRSTMKVYLHQWLQTLAPSLKPATARRYRDLIDQHMIPVIGSIRLGKLNPADVQRLYADRLATGLSNTSVRHMHSVLHHALDDAVKWGLVNRNVTDAVDPPRRSAPEMTVWSREDVTRFLNAATDDPLEPLWTLALLTGMRRGELLGLKWGDIDLDAGTLSVRRTLSRGTGSELIEGAPKTKTAQRRIALPATAVESLRHHRARQNEYRLELGSVWEPNDYVFTNDVGRYLHPNSLTRQFTLAITRAGVPRIRFHDLRHTSATLLLAQGVHPKIVQERLGHANIAMTMDRYSHVTRDMQQQAAEALELAISRPKSTAS